MGWLAALPCVAALAQPMADPTRPPPERLAGAGTTASGAAGDAAPAGLQLVISGPGRQLALVDGRLLRRGQTQDGSTLLHTQAHQAVLRQHGQDTQLSLHPLVKKTLRPLPPPASR